MGWRSNPRSREILSLHRNTSRTSDHQGLFQGPNPTSKNGCPHSYPLISHFIICWVKNNLNRKSKSQTSWLWMGGGEPNTAQDPGTYRPSRCDLPRAHAQCTRPDSFFLLTFMASKNSHRGERCLWLWTRTFFISVSMKVKLTNFHLKNLQVKFASPLWGCVYRQQRS